jgi:hypothetical protein
LKSCLPYIIQQADEIACRVEWELDQSTKEVVNFEKSNSSSNYKDEAKEKKLEYISKHGKK